MTTCYQTMKSPVGPLVLAADEKNLRVITFENTWPAFKKKFCDLVEKDTPLLKEARKQLNDYFSKKRKTFDLPIKLAGTPFQNSVWKFLGKIPFGETRTYQQQADTIGSPKAVRAVGRTNGLNPFCIVLPCHRVIGSNGSLTGFAGGFKAKEFLLAMEEAL